MSDFFPVISGRDGGAREVLEERGEVGGESGLERGAAQVVEDAGQRLCDAVLVLALLGSPQCFISRNQPFGQMTLLII